MKPSIQVALAGLFLGIGVLFPAAAANFGKNPEGKLHFKPGANVQICQSAEAGATCRPAISGESVPPGTNVMVGPGAQAEIVYKHLTAGKNQKIVLDKPGVYTLNERVALPNHAKATFKEVLAANPGFMTFAALIAAAGGAASANGGKLVPISP